MATKTRFLARLRILTWRGDRNPVASRAAPRRVLQTDAVFAEALNIIVDPARAMLLQEPWLTNLIKKKKAGENNALTHWVRLIFWDNLTLRVGIILSPGVKFWFFWPKAFILTLGKNKTLTPRVRISFFIWENSKGNQDWAPSFAL